MKKVLHSLLIPAILSLHLFTSSQDAAVFPTITGTGVYHGLSAPLSDLPVISEGEFLKMVIDGTMSSWNQDLENREYPFMSTALPTGPDDVWQREMGTKAHSKTPLLNFNGQTSLAFPPDANGTTGPAHYMQTINSVYAIYNKVNGALVAGPTNMNQLFSGVTGASCNDGDPLILFDEEANRWLAIEFSICGSNDYMLVAVSQTSNPTGSWHKYSFDVADMPDYEKFGIWQDGYYMGTNNSSGNDIYVFQRSAMLTGGNPKFVGFNNPWRPSTIDGFHCVPPVDNDGPFAAPGKPGLFITINDDAIGGGDDELWIYELDVNWASTGSSTFDRVQQLAVPSFDSNFGNNWDNIKQPGTSQELDAIPMVIMNRPQYRNFGSYETIVCCHTVDVNGNDHAGIRWYELRRTSGNWTVRQSGTYAPDSHSRWMGSIALNGNNEIGLGYSISSTSVYPGIRYCGQSSSAYAAANGTLDMAEAIIQNGSNSQNNYNRWGDYANISVDPVNDHTFWFTSQYGGSQKTKIAAFEFAPAGLNAGFEASDQFVCKGGEVEFSSTSSGNPTTWSWFFQGGSPSSYNGLNPPPITYNTVGNFDVTLEIGDGTNNDIDTKSDFITVKNVLADFTATPTTIVFGNDVSFQDLSNCDPSAWNWSFPGGIPNAHTGQNPPPITYNTIGTFHVTLTVSNALGNDSETKNNYITVTDLEYCSSSGNGGEEWIEGVTLNGQTHASGSSGATGYEDFSNISYDLYSGYSNSIILDPGFPFKNSYEYWRVWIDYNRNGSFTDNGEQVFAANNIKGTVSGTFDVPEGLEVETRMRVSMKRDAASSPCESFNFGEVEDYTVNIAEPVPQTPQTDFSAMSTSLTAGGSVQFTDLTQHFPSSWLWTFDGGSPSSSTEQHPAVSYSSPGSFDVSLKTANSMGQDTEIKTGFITVHAPPEPTYCEPVSLSNGLNFISMITIGEMASATGQGPNGYMYYQNPVFEIAPAHPYDLSIVPGNQSEPYFLRIWMDLNNDLDFFDQHETVFQLDNGMGTGTGVLILPQYANGTVRMRVSLKSGSPAYACDDNYAGEMEDYIVSFVDVKPTSATFSGDAVTVYPVPLDDGLLHIKITGFQDLPTIEVYNSSGERVVYSKPNSHDLEVNLFSWGSGIYLVKVTVGNEAFIKKIIKM